MTTDFAFALGLITSCLQVIAVACSWVLSSYFGRRTIYLYGTAANITFLFALGIAATVTQSSKAQFAQACLGVIISFTFALTLGPISYTIIAETSSVRLRPLSTAVGRAAYYIAEIPCIYRESLAHLDMMIKPLTSLTPLHSRLANAQPYRLELGWKVRIYLGKYRRHLLHHRVLRLARASRTFVPRNRHSLQEEDLGEKVLQDRGRHARRRLGVEFQKPRIEPFRIDVRRCNEYNAQYHMQVTRTFDPFAQQVDRPLRMDNVVAVVGLTDRSIDIDLCRQSLTRLSFGCSLGLYVIGYFYFR